MLKMKRKQKHKMVPASWKVERAKWKEMIEDIKHYII